MSKNFNSVEVPITETKEIPIFSPELIKFFRNGTSPDRREKLIGIGEAIAECIWNEMPGLTYQTMLNCLAAKK